MQFIFKFVASLLLLIQIQNIQSQELFSDSNENSLKTEALANLTTSTFEIKADFQSSTLPLVFITIDSSSIEYFNDTTVADLGIVYNGPGNRNYINDTKNNYNDKALIITLNNREDLNRKSFLIKLLEKDKDNNVVKKSIVGLPAETEFTLECVFADKSLIRNVLAYSLARKIGLYAPRTMFCEVFINEYYSGIYVFTEKIKPNKNGVNISEMKDSDTNNIAITGGYIFKIDDPSKKDGIYYKLNFNAPHLDGLKPQYNIVHPETPNGKQISYLKNYIAAFEKNLKSDTFNNPINGYHKYIDYPSFIDYLLINELAKNNNGYRLKSYFYKQNDSQGGKLFAGPIFGFDYAFANGSLCEASDPSDWAYDYNYVCPERGIIFVPFWWERLVEDTNFANNIDCRWYSLRKNKLSDNSILKCIDSIYSVIKDPQKRDYNINKLKPFFSPYVYLDQINIIKDWILNRTYYMDDYTPGYCVMNSIKLAANKNSISISPNPINSNSSIKVKVAKNLFGSLIITDMTGRNVLSIPNMYFTIGNNNIYLNKECYKKGLYFVKLHLKNGEVLNTKFVVN